MEQKYAGLSIEDRAALLELKRFGSTETKLHHVVDIQNIDDALAQIAEMKAAQKPAVPPTWNDAINSMSVGEKARWLIDFSFLSCESWCPAYDPAGKYLGSSCDNECVKHLTEYLASPYDGGKAQEGAEE